MTEELKKTRVERSGNEYYSIDDLPLTDIQKECVLEYLARKLWKLLLDLDVQCGHCKHYDPLMIEGNTALSYVYDMEEGGRRHKFRDYKHLEDMLYNETLEQIREEINPQL